MSELAALREKDGNNQEIKEEKIKES